MERFRPTLTLASFQVTVAVLVAGGFAWLGLARGGEEHLVWALGVGLRALAGLLPIVLLAGGGASGRSSGAHGLVEGFAAAGLGGIGGVLLYVVVGTNTAGIFGGLDALAVQARLLEGSAAWLVAPPLLSALAALWPVRAPSPLQAPPPSAPPSPPPSPPRETSMKPFKGDGFRLAIPRSLERQPDDDGPATWRGPGELLRVSSSRLESAMDKPRRQTLIMDLMGREKDRYDVETEGRAEYRASKHAQEGRDDGWLAGRDTKAGRRFVTALAVGESLLVAIRYECSADLRDDDELLVFLGAMVDSLRIST